MRFSTKDQRFYTVDEQQIKAEIDVYLTNERFHGEINPPSIEECRHAILQINNGAERNAYVVYDRLLNRIVNGVYYLSLEEVLNDAAYYNEDPNAPQDMIPNGVALGLKYPVVDKSKNVPLLFHVDPEISDVSEKTQRVEILRHAERLLKEVTLLRGAADKEARANRRRKNQKWTELDKLNAKLTELEEYIHPGEMPTGLHPMYCDDPSFECYVLVSD